jgi:hypothetical protein
MISDAEAIALDDDINRKLDVFIDEDVCEDERYQLVVDIVLRVYAQAQSLLLNDNDIKDTVLLVVECTDVIKFLINATWSTRQFRELGILRRLPFLSYWRRLALNRPESVVGASMCRHRRNLRKAAEEEELRSTSYVQVSTGNMLTD